MSLRELEVFVAAAEQGSLAGAARAAHVERSVATRELARLEARIGQPLAVRDARNFTLTAHGRALLPHARAILHAASEVARPQRVRGTLAVSACPSLASRFVPILLAFLDEHPEVRLDVSGPACADAVDVRFLLSSDPDGDAVVVGKKTAVLAASPDYWGGAARPQTSSDLMRHRVLDVGTTSNWREVVGVDVPVSMTAEDPAIILALAESGGGVARLPEPIARAAMTAGRLERVLPGVSVASYSVVAVVSPRSSREPLTRALIRFSHTRWGDDAYALCASAV